MKHIILTRLYFKDDSMLDKYLNMCKKILIPSFESQTCKNFEWVIIARDAHVDHINNVLKYPFTRVSDNADFANYAIKNNITIQTRHDCDDWMSPNYIETIQRLYTENKEKYPILVIQSQPMKWMYHENKEGKLPPYTRLRTSMHLTICQKDVKYSIHEKKHAEMGRLADHVITLEEGYTKWVIHGDNITLNRNRKQ